MDREPLGYLEAGGQKNGNVRQGFREKDLRIDWLGSTGISTYRSGNGIGNIIQIDFLWDRGFKELLVPLVVEEAGGLKNEKAIRISYD